TRLPPSTRLRVAGWRPPSAGQPQPPGRDGADDLAGPRHPRPLRGPCETSWLGAAAHADRAATRAHEGSGGGPLARSAGTADRRDGVALLPPAALLALPGAAS